MRLLIAAAALVYVVSGAAQDPTPAPAPVPVQVPAPPPFPDNLVFTLKKPTKYEMPKPVQLIIAACLQGVPLQAAVWRDEYANIFEDKEDVRKWLDGNLSAWFRALSAEGNAQISAGNTDQAQLIQNAQRWVLAAKDYVKNGW